MDSQVLLFVQGPSQHIGAIVTNRPLLKGESGPFKASLPKVFYIFLFFILNLNALLGCP